MTEPMRLDAFHLDGLIGLVRAGQLPVEQAIQDIMARPLLARGALERRLFDAGTHDPTISNGEPTETPEHMWLAEGNA
jgi:hypothetical protein